MVNAGFILGGEVVLFPPLDLVCPLTLVYKLHVYNSSSGYALIYFLLAPSPPLIKLWHCISPSLSKINTAMHIKSTSFNFFHMTVKLHFNIPSRLSLQQMLDLTQLANSKKSELLPQKKFAFLSRKKEGPSSNMPDGAAKSHVEAKSQPVKKKVLEDTSKVFGNKTDENLELRVGYVLPLPHFGCGAKFNIVLKFLLTEVCLHCCVSVALLIMSCTWETGTS